MSPRGDTDPVCARAMHALDAELTLSPELEARLLDAALGDPAARAMSALDEDLSIPKDIEARLLGALPRLMPSNEAAPARDAYRPPPSTPTVRRPRLALWLSLGAAIAAGVAVAGFAWVSSRHVPRSELASQAAAQEAEDAAALASALDWDAKPWAENMAVLEELRKHIHALSSREATQRIAPRYAEAVRRGFLDAGKTAIEDALRTSTGDHALEEHVALKEYLLLADSHHLHAEGGWEADKLTTTCAATIEGRSSVHVSGDELRATIRPHLVAWLFLVETEIVAGPMLDQALVDRTRHALSSAPPILGYSSFVDPIAQQRRNPSAAASRDNLAYPPLTLDSIFASRPEWLSIVRSKSKDALGKPYEVGGEFTKGARLVIVRSLDEAKAEAARDAWVVGDGSDKGLLESIARVGEEYDERYIDRWVGFVRDLEIAKVDSNHRSRMLRILGGAESPFSRLLRTVADNTQGTRDDTSKDLVADRFRSVADFAAGDKAPLAGYSATLLKLAGDLDQAPGGGAPRLLQAAAKQARALTTSLDDGTRDMLTPLLLAPLDASAPHAR